MNVCVAVAFLLVNTLRESVEKRAGSDSASSTSELSVPVSARLTRGGMDGSSLRSNSLFIDSYY